MIPAEVIAEVRARNELVGFIESSGVRLRRRGADYVGLCPFHAGGAERTPSLVVNSRKQLWCCHGACSANGKRVGGDVIAFAMRLWNVTFPEAVARLKPELASLHCSAPAESPDAAKEKDAAPTPALLERLVNYYVQNLARSQEAQAYLASRGLRRPELLAALRVGYSDGTLTETTSEASPLRKELTAAGLITAAGELFFRCVVLPLLDLAGVVVGMYARSIEGDRHLYLPGPRRGLVNAACAATSSEIIITESVIDAMSFLEAGIPNAVPIYGVNGWTADHDELLEKHRIRRVILALDSDEAGQKASAAIAGKLLARAIDITTIVLPAKDANEMLVEMGADRFAAEWKKLRRSASSTQMTGKMPVPPSSAPAGKMPAPLSPEAAKEKDAAQPFAEASPAASTRPAALVSSAPAEGAAPVAAKENPSLALEDGAYVLSFEKRRYLIRGLVAIGVDRLRVNVRVEQEGRFHVDTLDLYSARARRSFIEDLTETLGCDDQASLQREIAAVIEALERERLQLRVRGKSTSSEKKAMTAADRDEAVEFLTAPALLDILRADFVAVGCIGEETAMLISFLAIVSRLLPEPLAVLSCARSGAGKSTLQERATDFVPPELLIKLTRITGQALFYRDEHALVNKVLAVDEEEGAAEAAYALRCLQSAGYLAVSSTRTDPHTGRQHAEDYRVYGPTTIFLTTAHPEALDYETRNRFVILTVDESKEQTRRILDLQRANDTLDGLCALEGRKAILRRHHNAQRLLQPLRVVNPFARELVYPTDRLILRREHKKYLTLIKGVALLHQFQRERKREGAIEYIEVTREDIELARELAPLILRRSLDELAPPTRSLLVDIRRLALAKMSEQRIPQHHAVIDRREIQAATGLSSWHLREYLQQLVEFEYLASVTGRKGSRYVYELLWDGSEEDLESVLRK